MEKLKLLSNGLLGRVLLLFALLTSSAGAMAQSVQEIKLDTEYTVGAFQSPNYSFKATETGRIYMYCSNQYFPTLWKNSSFTEEIYVERNTYNNPRWTYSVEAGKTYYLGYGLSCPWETTTFRITMQGLTKVELNVIEPAENTVLSIGMPISVGFNVPVEMGTATLAGGTAEPVTLSREGFGNYASFEVKDILYGWMTDGKLKENDVITLTINDVHSSSDETLKGGEDGKMVFTWKACPMPVSLVNASLPEKIISKWESGDPAGIAVFEFSGKLAQGACAYIENGDVSKGGTHEDLPVSVKDNKIYVDFTGVSRFPAVENTYRLDVYNVHDAAGYPAYSPGVGTVGSYGFAIDFEGEPFIEPALFMFDPDNDTNIKGVKEIGIFVTNVTSAFQYTGASFDYTVNYVPQVATIEKKDIVEENGGTEAMLLVKVPAELANADEGSNVLFKLLNGEATVAKASYTYGEVTAPVDFNITLISPEDGATLEKIAGDESIRLEVVGVPDNADIEIEGVITDNETGESVKNCFFSPEEGEGYNYACQMWDDVDLIDGHTYTFTLTASSYPIDEEGFRGAPTVIATRTYTFYGAGVEYKYSEVQLTGMDPDPTKVDILSTDQATVTVTFSAPVSEMRAVQPIGMGAGVIEYETAKANEDGTEWTFTIPESIINNAKGTIEVNMYAKDAEGLILYKSALYDAASWTGIPDAMQAKDETYFSLMFKCTVGSPEVTVVPENNSTVESLDKFVLSYPLGISFSWNTSEDIVLYKGLGFDQQEVQRWSGSYFDIWENADKAEFNGENPVAWTLTLDEAQTEPGLYTLCLPNTFFNLGTEFDLAGSKQQFIRVTIEKGGTPDVPATFGIALVSPENGATLEKLGADDSILLNITGLPEEGDIEIMGVITDDTTGEQVKWCYFSAPEEEAEGYNYSCQMWEDLDMIEGHSYTLVITATAYTYDEEGYRTELSLGSETYTFYGSGKEYLYSNVQLLGVTPDLSVEIMSPEQNVITVSFSAPVSEMRVLEPMGMGAGAIEYEVAKADEDGTEWTFTIPESTINKSTSTFSVVLYARDAEGLPLWDSATWDEEAWAWVGVPDAWKAKDETCFTLEFKCTVGSPEIAVTPEDGSVLKSFDKIVLSYAGGMNYMWATSEDVVLYRGLGAAQEEIQRWDAEYFDPMLNAANCEFAADGYTPVAWTLALNEEQTTPGVYTLSIPSSFFVLGSEFDQANNKQQLITITIEETTAINAIAAENAGNGAAFNLAGQKVADSYKGIIIVNGKKVLKK